MSSKYAREMDKLLDLTIKLELHNKILDFNILYGDGYEIIFKDTESLKTFVMFFGLCVNLLRDHPYKIACKGNTVHMIN